MSLVKTSEIKVKQKLLSFLGLVSQGKQKIQKILKAV